MSLERYDIRSKIGEGGVGAVYRAFDRNLNREVAIKRVLAEEGDDELGEEATARMLKEANALCSVQHPNIVTVFDAGVDEDGPYVVMELLSGRTLDEMVQLGPLSLEDFREIAVQSQEALVAAQDLDLVHRDIKPSNLMVTRLPSGRFHTKLVDFGLAKFSAKPSHQTIDHGDAVFGSIRFMAPEQFERTPLDKRTDMYAIGCVYYYCLTGRYPFDGETAPQVMTAHLQHQVTPISELRPDIPGWLGDWVMWHISRSMDDRPADARKSLQKFLMSENNPEAGTPEIPQADSNPPTSDAPTSPVDPATAPQSVQPASPQPQAARPKFIIPGQEPAPAPAPAPAAPAPQPQAEAPAPAPLQPAPEQAAAPVQPAPAQPAPEPTTAPVTVQPAAQAQAVPAPAANPLMTPAAPAPQATPAPAPAPAPQVAPVQLAAPAPVQAAAPAPAQPVAAPQITVPLSGTPATPAPPAQPAAPAAPAANPLLVAGAAPQPAAPAPQAAAPLGVPPQPAAPLGAPKPAGVGIGSVAPLQKKGISNAVKGMIATTLVAALIVAGIIWKGKSDANDRVDRLNTLVEPFQEGKEFPENIPLSTSDVQLLLDELTTAGVKDKMDRPTYLQVLTLGKSSDGVDISAEVAAYARDIPMESALRIKLYQVVGARGEESALPALIEFAKATDDTSSGQAAINAAKKMATTANFESLLSIVTGSSSASIKNSAVDVLSKVVSESEDPGSYSKVIVGIYKSTPDEDGKIALLRLMGSAGGDEAADLIADALGGDNAKLQVAAVYALRNWPDDAQFETLYEFASTVENDRLRGDAFSSLVGFLKDGSAEIDEDDKSLYWNDVASISTGEIEQRTVVDAMVSQKGDWADDILDFFVEEGDSEKVQFRAEKAKAARKLKKERDERGGVTEDDKDKDEDE